MFSRIYGQTRRLPTHTKPLGLKHLYRRKSEKSAEGFLDCVQLYVQGGAGGQGSRRFSSPGGDGGDVLVVADANYFSLQHLAEPTKFKASCGDHAQRHQKANRGKDVVIRVPVGTVLLNAAGLPIADLSKHGQCEVVANGGEGGSVLTEHCNGVNGDTRQVTLELKSIADVGLVGFPNAGKSSLLKVLSRAQPKVADYPFTTLRPNVGVLEFPDHYSMRIADIPGLIEGAHLNKGMGHNFLRHIERTKILLFVVDVSGFQLSNFSDKRTALDCTRLLMSELGLYSKILQRKPAIIAVNKMDLPNAAECFEQFKNNFSEINRSTHAMSVIAVVPISTMSGEGITPLTVALRKLYSAHTDKTVRGSSEDIFERHILSPMPDEQEYRVEKEKHDRRTNDLTKYRIERQKFARVKLDQ